MIRIQHVPYWFESRLDPFVRRHEKLKGPKGLSQEVRDTAVIHNQASLRPCIRQRGITPALSTGMRQYYIQNKACNSIPIGMAKTAHQTISFWYLHYSNICALPHLSVEVPCQRSQTGTSILQGTLTGLNFSCVLSCICF